MYPPCQCLNISSDPSWPTSVISSLCYSLSASTLNFLNLFLHRQDSSLSLKVIVFHPSVLVQLCHQQCWGVMEMCDLPVVLHTYVTLEHRTRTCPHPHPDHSPPTFTSWPSQRGWWFYAVCSVQLIPGQRCWFPPQRSAASHRAWCRKGTEAGPGGWSRYEPWHGDTSSVRVHKPYTLTMTVQRHQSWPIWINMDHFGLVWISLSLYLYRTGPVLDQFRLAWIIPDKSVPIWTSLDHSESMSIHLNRCGSV